jgi:hypothetical protein
MIPTGESNMVIPFGSGQSDSVAIISKSARSRLVFSTPWQWWSVKSIELARSIIEMGGFMTPTLVKIQAMYCVFSIFAMEV